MKKKMFLIILTLVSLALLVVAASNVSAKSLYVCSNTNDAAAPIQAYNINVDGTFTYQATYNTDFGWGSVGLAIDSNSGYLFLTQESIGTLSLINGTTMVGEGSVVAPGASNLAGVVYDHKKELLYMVDRYSDKLYSYVWDPDAKTLTLEAGFPLNLPSGNFYGIALDETNDILYAANYNNVTYYDTATWSLQGTITLSNIPIGIAVDYVRGFLYTGSGFAWNNIVCKYDLASSTETIHTMTDGVMGLAVDQITGYVYATHGFGEDNLSAWDTSTTPFTQLDITDDIGDPAGLCIPIEDVSYNPLNLEKDDRLEVCVSSGDEINYTICFDNMNEFTVNNVKLEDTLPSEVIFVDASDGGSYDSVNHNVTWDFGTISTEEGGCAWLLVQVDPLTPSETIIINYATIESDETPPTTKTEESTVCGEIGDATPPLQTVEFGEPKISTEWYGVVYNVVSCSTPIWINSTDPGGVGSSHINYSMWRADDPNPKPNGQITFIKLYEKTVYDGDPEDIDPDYGEITVLEFTQQSCIHEILYECWDYEGNTDSQRDFDFIADCCGPETLKEIGQPQYGSDYPNWVSDETPLWFNSTDKCCLPNGTAVSYIVVEVWWKSNFSDLQESYKLNKTITVYDGDPTDDNAEDGRISYEFYFDDSCCHELRWYGVDIFGNVEVIKKQKHKVDVDQPEIIKTVGDPNCTVVPGEEYCITPDTPITVYAEDRGCMGGVGIDILKYRIWNESHGWEDDWHFVAELEEVYFNEECTHYLEIVAIDILGNIEKDNETFYVDNTTPTIDKIVGLPNCYITEGEYCVTTSTNITINASDMGCCDSLIVEYRVWNDSFDSGWVLIGQLPFNFSFTDECFHHLDIRAYDCLGHIIYDNETFYVDDSPPIIEKTIGDPKCIIIDGEEYCITTQTSITINASNDGCCTNQSFTLRYRINNEDWTYPDVLPVTINILDECNHTLTINVECFIVPVHFIHTVTRLLVTRTVRKSLYVMITVLQLIHLLHLMQKIKDVAVKT